MFVWIENIEKNYTNSQVAGKQFSGLSGWAAAAAAGRGADADSGNSSLPPS